MFADLRLRLRSLFKKNAVDASLSDELRFHFDQQVQKLVASGVPPDEARRRARLALGTHDKIQEEFRDASGVRFFESLVQDIRFALRMLRKSPGFTAVAVLTLALGIGANAAIFSLLDGLVLRDLPVPHPEQLVRVAAHTPDDSDSGLSLPMFEEIARSQKVFSSMFTWQDEGIANVEINGALSQGDVWPIGGNFYSNLGAVPEIGRLIGPQDVDLHSLVPAQVAVLGYDYWHLRFGGDKNVVGQTIKIEQTPFTIIGVTQRGFAGMTADTPFQIAIPLTTSPLVFNFEGNILPSRDALWLEGTARLKPGVTLDQARAQLNSLWPTIRNAAMPLELTPEQRGRFLALQLTLTPGSKGDSFVRGRFSAPLYILLGISGFILLITCVNLAGLMLSRAVARSHEMGVRVALGAGRWRLVRQMLTESVMLSTAGALAGLILGLWGSEALSNLIFSETYIVPAALNLKPDLRMFAFASVVAILTGVLFGLAPALRASAEHPNAALLQGSRSVSRGTGHLGKSLTLTQIVLSLVLLAGAGLFIRSLENLRDVHPGFKVQGLLDVNLYGNPGGYKNIQWGAYYHQLTDKVAGLPGVESVGISHMRPGWMEWNEQVARSSSSQSSTKVNCAMSMPGFFRTMGIGLLRGRTFTWRDDDHAPRVALVSESLARALFPTGNALDQRIDVTSEPKWKGLQIVGIVSDASVYNIRKHAPPTVYLPSIQYGDYSGWSQLMVRTEIAPAGVENSIREAVQSLGHEYVWSTQTVATDINHSILQERVTAMLSEFFGGLALLIAGIGLFGLMAFSVTRRTRELGIRFALGAQRGGVLRMILRETLALTVVGIVIGIPCALAATRLISHMLFGVTPYDPLTMILVSIALLIVGALAGYIPARRAMKVDPMVALRYE